jgi:diguanylate cyclase (GGDEF)-like protein
MEAEANRQQTLTRMSQMVAELEAHHQQTALLYRLNDLTQSCRNEEEAHVIIRVTLGELFSNTSGCLALSRPHGLEPVARWGDEGEVTAIFQTDDCWALRQGHAHEVLEPANELVCQHFGAVPAHGYLCLPLMVHGDLIGLLHLAYPAALNQKTRDNLRDLLRSAGETIKLSLSNLRMREAMREQATHDPLTGLCNRRYLDEALPREVHRALREQQTLAVAMLDIDHFKRFNDSFGHEAGDRVLQEIGQVLQENLRRSDIACRYGGEELAVIMPDSSADDAKKRLDEICGLIRAISIEFRHQALPAVSVSVGIAEAPGHGRDAVELLRAADTALYAAKAAGRDRIVVCGEEPR